MLRDVIKDRLAERGQTIADFGRAIGRTRTVASRILAGEVKLQIKHVRPLAKLLGWPERDVLTMFGLEFAQPQVRVLPVVGQVQAGNLTEAIETTDLNTVAMSHASDAAFGLVVEGESMNRIAPPGCIVICDRAQKDLAPNDLAVFLRAGEATFKRFVVVGNRAMLAPESFDPTFAAIALDGDEPVEVVGRVTDILQIPTHG